jgi:SAM-dependent methyltransferase
MVAQAKAKAAERVQRVAFLVADIADFKPAARFDVITMLNMPPFLEPVAALLRPDGLVINASSYGPATPFWIPPSDAGPGLRAPRASYRRRPERGRRAYYLAQRPNQ